MVCNKIIILMAIGGGKGGAMGLQPHLILRVLHRILIFYYKSISCKSISHTWFDCLPPPLLMAIKWWLHWSDLCVYVCIAVYVCMSMYVCSCLCVCVCLCVSVCVSVAMSRSVVSVPN